MWTRATWSKPWFLLFYNLLAAACIILLFIAYFFLFPPPHSSVCLDGGGLIGELSKHSLTLFFLFGLQVEWWNVHIVKAFLFVSTQGIAVPDDDEGVYASWAFPEPLVIPFVLLFFPLVDCCNRFSTQITVLDALFFSWWKDFSFIVFISILYVCHKVNIHEYT